MANSAFKKNRPIHIPVTVSNGGTGRSSLTDKSVLIGAGTGDVNLIPPGVSGDVLVSNGTSWASSGAVADDGSITYAKLATDLVGSASISAVDIDWSTFSIFEKIITSNTVFTFSNYQLNKVITLIIKGNYIVIFPKTVKIITGIYDGWTTNYITLHCTKATASQEVWAIINKKNYITPYGYFSGGLYGATIVVTVDRIVFSTGVTSANTVSNLSQARMSMAGLSDCSTYGYFSGGSGPTNITDRIVFSTGITSANTVSNLSQARDCLAGLSDGTTYGYFAGGNTGSSYTSNVITADRIVFSTSVTSANTVSDLSQATEMMGSLSDGLTYGYFSGGETTSYIATTDRIVFSTGITSANTVSELSEGRWGLAGLSDSAIYGYFAGGYIPSGSVYFDITDRIIFSTGIISANTVSNLSQARDYLAGLSDGTTYGYFAGGFTGAGVVTADRIVFSTGVTSAKTVSNLSQLRSKLTGLSNNAV